MQVLSPVRRIRIAKWLDEHVGGWLTRRMIFGQSKASTPPDPQPVQRILVIKFWGIGSIVLMEPALRLLRRRFPGAQVEFLTLQQNRELFTLIPHVDTVHAIEFGSLAALMVSSMAVLRQLRRRRFDCVYDAEFFANFSAILGRLAAPRRLIGFARPGVAKQCLLDVAVPFNNFQHAVENFMRLVAVNDRYDRRAVPDEQATPRIEVLCRRTALKRPYVVINANASPLALERRWPAERFAHLARWLARRFNTQLLFIGARAEWHYTRDLIARIGCNPNVHNLAGRLSLQRLASVMAQSSLVISNDSGPLHLAAAAGVPVVAFFGPETPRLFGPVTDRKLVLYQALPCSPCMSVDNAKSVNCTNHLQCLRQLDTEAVIQRLHSFVLEHCPALAATAMLDCSQTAELSEVSFVNSSAGAGGNVTAGVSQPVITSRLAGFTQPSQNASGITNHACPR